jgi:hypothetical protein
MRQVHELAPWHHVYLSQHLFHSAIADCALELLIRKVTMHFYRDITQAHHGHDVRVFKQV